MEHIEHKQQEETAIEKVRNAATVYQLATGIVIMIVTVSFFFFTLQSKTNTANEKNDLQERAIEKLQDADIRTNEKLDANQKEIMQKLEQINISLERKQNRVN